MTISPLKALLFLLGGAVAAGIAAYFAGAFDTYLGRPAPMVAALPGDEKAALLEKPTGMPATAPGEAPNVEAPKVEAPKVEAPKVEAPKEAPPADAAAESAPKAGGGSVTPPSFDVLRVEPDGSLVIAGKANAHADVEVVAGTQVLARAAAGPEGDFAVVLDKPLAPGDYQIVLRSTARDNVAATSLETAVVSVPDDSSGQVLALVEEPGKPSRLITVPEASPAGATAASASGARQPTGPAPNANDAAGGDGKPAAVPENSTPNVAGGSEAASGAQAPRTEDRASDGTAAGTAPTDANTGQGGKADAVALASPGPAASSPSASGTEVPASSAKRPAVRVEAVEIEGRRIFVAGQGEPGMTVVVYANDILLGQATVSSGGRFLIETERDLPVGDYIIRADMVTDGGRRVVARAAVPFQREAAEAQAAVAAAPQTAAAEASRGDVGSVVAPASDGGGEAAAAQTPPATVTKPVEVEAIVAAPLRPVDGSVIIRRGDSLWRISRRVYGRGVRYSTIYVANQEQIADPNRIWPGQIFRVPEKTREGEVADMEAIANQSVPAAAGGPSPAAGTATE